MKSFTMLDAVQIRMKQLATERNKSPVEIGKKGGLRQSTISEIYRGKNSKYPKIITIQKFCNGAGITIGEFFSDEIFEKTDEAQQLDIKKTDALSAPVKE